MLILGLTGSIAMGKSRAAAMFETHGVPVFDSDLAVHRLYRPGGAAVAAVLRRFPDCRGADGGIDRDALARQVLTHPAALRALEKIVHRLVRDEQRHFLERQARDRRWLAVLDVPLLYETGGNRRCDRVAVVSASAPVQRWRALQRRGMTDAKLARVLANQRPDSLKRARADFVIPSGADRGLLASSIAAIMRTMRPSPPRAWPARWQSNG